MNVHESLANLYYSIILMYRYNNEPNIDPCGNPNSFRDVNYYNGVRAVFSSASRMAADLY